jgi:hypothetical protein
MKNTKTHLWVRLVATTMKRMSVLIVVLACCPVAGAMQPRVVGFNVGKGTMLNIANGDAFSF